MGKLLSVRECDVCCLYMHVGQLAVRLLKSHPLFDYALIYLTPFQLAVLVVSLGHPLQLPLDIDTLKHGASSACSACCFLQNRKQQQPANGRVKETLVTVLCQDLLALLQNLSGGEIAGCSPSPPDQLFKKKETATAQMPCWSYSLLSHRCLPASLIVDDWSSPRRQPPHPSTYWANGSFHH